MKSSLAFALLLVGLLARVGGAQPSQQEPFRQSEETYQRQVTKTFGGAYLVYLPDNYEAQAGVLWPVIFYLHGADARGENLEKVKQEGLPSFLRSGTKLPFVVVAPLCAPDEWWESRWSVENLDALLDEIVEKYRVDSSRIYLTGWSMGGAGTWRWASQHPARFAAIAPISGHAQLRYVAALKQTPTWVFHGAKDAIVPLGESQKMVDALQKSGGDARLTVLADTDHDAWPQVYSDPKFYSWLLEHSTKK